MQRARLSFPVLVLLVASSCEGAKAKSPAPVAQPGGAPAAAEVAAPRGPGGFGGTSFRFPAPEALTGSRPAAAPMSLTASDGTGLRLVSLDVRAVVQEPLAFTELRLAFQNPEDRTIEGHFRITLPQGATVSRFAMRQNEAWQEGEVVEKQAARRAYEDALHRRQDPALLEQGAANEFTARVFPIPAKGVKELVVSYSQELTTQDTRWTLPLRGLPQLGRLDVAVHVPGAVKPVAELKKTQFVPDRDFEVPPAHLPGRAGLRNADLAVARVRPLAVSKPDEIASAVILFDTSASRALGFSEQVKLLDQLVRGLAQGGGAQVPLTVACFDQTVVPIFDGVAGDFGEADLKRIRDRRPLGASDLRAALRWTSTRGEKSPSKRVILITDGVATAGPTEGDELLAAVLKLKQAGVERLDAVAVGGIRNDALLRRLVTAGLARDGVVSGAEDLVLLGKRLTEATSSKRAVEVKGATWWWPRRLDGVQAGDEVLVYAELPATRALEVKIGGAAVSVGELPTVDRPLLERAATQARIAELLHKLDVEADGKAQKAAIQAEIVKLSVAHRVLSPYTALLVLETEQDYARFGIERKALADILTVAETGKLGRVVRTALLPPAPTKEDENSLEGRPFVRSTEKKQSASHDEDAPKGAGAPETSESASPPPPREARKEEAMPMPKPSASGDFEAERRRAAPASAPALYETRYRTIQIIKGGPVSDERHPADPDDDEAVNQGEVSQGEAPQKASVAPWTGKFKEVMETVAKGNPKAALAIATGWHEEDAGDVMALVGMGEALEALGDFDRAARAYGSIIDLFPSRADLRRFAGERLERLKGDAGVELAADTFAQARLQRPDHPASHRLLAFALVRKKEFAKAFDTLVAALKQDYPDGRFAGARQILAEDLGLVAAVWMRAEPARKGEILVRLKDAGGAVEDAPSVRFVLNWETDANDVDFHIYDGRRGHAFYRARRLASGGTLYADVTTGYGPECFTIRKPRGARAYPYTLQAHYYSRGPMGYGMGKLQILEHDGAGGLTMEERTFVVMVDQAFVDLGKVTK